MIKYAELVGRKPSNLLLEAIAEVESNNGDVRYGDWIRGMPRTDPNNARAWGKFQEHRNHVDDYNRLTGANDSYASRLDNADSRRRSRYIMQYYGNRPGVQPTDENFARIHNGGPNGWRNPATVQYWEKVRAAKERILQRSRPARPVQQQPTPAAPNVVQPGDTLWRMWQRRPDKAVTWPQFQQRFQTANPGVDVNKLKPGMTYR